jgi:hypothetical protein
VINTTHPKFLGVTFMALLMILPAFSGAAQNFITLFNNVKDVYGINSENYLANPLQWANLALDFGAM